MTSIRLAGRSRRPFRQPEESRPGPLGAGNVARDLGQGSVELTLELEAVLGDADRVGSPMPFSNETRAGFDLGPWRRRNRSARFELRGQGHQSAPRHFGRAAMGGLLQPVGNGPNHNIAAQPWRVGPKESPPFQTQVCDAELSQDRETIRHLARAVRWARRSPSPDFGTVRRLEVVLVEAGGGGPPMRRGGRIVLRPPRQALRTRSHRDYEASATAGRAR